MSKKKEILSFLIPSVVILTLYLINSKYTTYNINYSRFIELFITALSILVGFLLTAFTLLYSISNNKIDFIKNSGAMHTVIRPLKKAIIYGIASIIISLLVFLLEDIQVIGSISIFVYIAIWADLFALSLCLFSIHTFLNIMTD